MEVIANGQKIPFNITEEKNWSDVLKTLLLLTNQANKLIFECKINGEIISLIERNKYTDCTVESIEKIEITVANKAQRVIDSLKEIEQVYPTFINALSDVSNVLISGQKHKALTKFAETLELWRQVVNFLRVIENSFNLKFNEIEVNGKKVETANTELYNLLASIKKAINDEDLVTISDLVEYELRDKFEEQKDICIALQKVIQEQADQLARQMQ